MFEGYGDLIDVPCEFLYAIEEEDGVAEFTSDTDFWIHKAVLDAEGTPYTVLVGP